MPGECSFRYRSSRFVRPLPEVGSSTSTYLKRATTSGRLNAHREDFLHSDYLRITKSDVLPGRIPTSKMRSLLLGMRTSTMPGVPSE